MPSLPGDLADLLEAICSEEVSLGRNALSVRLNLKLRAEQTVDECPRNDGLMQHGALDAAPQILEQL